MSYSLPMIRLSVALALLSMGLPGNVYGCTCSIRRAERACTLTKDPAQVLFIGTVAVTDGKKKGMSRFTFQVDESFSSASTREVDVYSFQGCCACGMTFRVGGKYLVDGWLGNGRITTTYCTKTRLFHDSDPLIAELRAIREGKKPDSLFGIVRRAPSPRADAGMGFPLGGVTLRLHSDKLDFEAKSDTDGVYRFREIPAAKYSMSTDLPRSLILGDPYNWVSEVPLPVAENACGEFNVRVLNAAQRE